MTSQADISNALAARQRAIEDLLIAFDAAVKAGQAFEKLAQAEGIQTPVWALEGVEYPIVFQALDTFFPMVVRRPQTVREYHVNTPDGIVVEKYLG